MATKTMFCEREKVKAIYFDLGPELGPDIIKENCKFALFNYSTLTVLDRSNEIISANWPDNKHIICIVHNDNPVTIPSHPYVLLNRSILCNCSIEVENNFLLESLAACQDVDSKLVMTL